MNSFSLDGPGNGEAHGPGGKDVHGHGGNLWAAAASLGRPADTVTDFSASMNPLGPPPAVVKLLADRLEVIRHYPEPHGGQLRIDLAAHHGVQPDQVLVGNGAAEVIYLLLRALRPRRTLIPVPTFSEYARSAAAAGSRIDYFVLDPGQNFAVNVTALARALGANKYDLVFLCNPNNPTGTWLDPEGLQTLVRAARGSRTLLAVDESFAGFLTPAGEKSPGRLGGPGVPRPCGKPPANVFTIGSFTKLYALPGLRLGYGLGPQQLVAAMEAHRDPWSVNALAQLAGRACLAEDGYVAKTRRLIAAARRGLLCTLGAVAGVKAYPSAANFLLLNTRDSGMTAGRVWEEMLARSVLIRDCSNFRGLDGFYLRVAVRRTEENSLLADSLARVLNPEDGREDRKEPPPCDA